MSGEQIKKSRSKAEVEAVVAPQVGEVALTEGLTEEVDDILDEIDSVLEENAEEFVRDYVQKGGQ